MRKRLIPPPPTRFEVLLKDAYDTMSANFVHQALIHAHRLSAVPNLEQLSPRIPYVFHAQLRTLSREFLTLPPRKRLKTLHYIACG